MAEALKRAYRYLCMLLVCILALSPATALANQNNDVTGRRGTRRNKSTPLPTTTSIKRWALRAHWSRIRSSATGS